MNYLECKPDAAQTENISDNELPIVIAAKSSLQMQLPVSVWIKWVSLQKAIAARAETAQVYDRLLLAATEEDWVAIDTFEAHYKEKQEAQEIFFS